MKKVGLIFGAIVIGLSCGACSNLHTHKSTSKEPNSSKVRVKRHHNHKSKRKPSNKSASSSSTNSSTSLQSSSSKQINNSQQVAQQTQASQANNQQSNDRLPDGTSVYDLPLSDPRNPDSYKQGQLMDIAGDPKYHNPDGSMNQQGIDLSNQIEASFHQGN